MARSRKTTKPANFDVATLIDPAAETAMTATPVDHHTQLGSWTAPVEPEAPADTTDPTLPMGEDGNSLVDTIEPLEPSADPVDEAERLVPYEIDPEAVTAADEPVSDEVAEDLVRALEALTEVPVQPAEADPVEEPQAPSFDEVVAALNPDDVDEMVWATKIALDEREAFEKEKNSDNDNIQRTLKKVRNQMVTKRAAGVLLATNVDPDRLFNRSIHDGSRYNVYALGKVADIVFGVTNGGAISNAINLACMRSLFAFRKAGLPFTMEVAKLACSKQMHCEAALRAHLVRHTVSPSTAPTQASSTMQALTTLGIVTASGPTRNPTYTLTDHPIVAKIEAVLAAA